MTVVLDTNVLFAALTAREGLCARVFELCASRHHLVSSEYIRDELRRHLEAKRSLTPEQVDAALAAITGPVTRIVTPIAVTGDACRDPNDLPVLGTALAGGAQVIVTGDKDLLVLGKFQSVLILSP